MISYEISSTPIKILIVPAGNRVGTVFFLSGQQGRGTGVFGGERGRLPRTATRKKFAAEMGSARSCSKCNADSRLMHSMAFLSAAHDHWPPGAEQSPLDVAFNFSLIQQRCPPPENEDPINSEGDDTPMFDRTCSLMECAAVRPLELPTLSSSQSGRSAHGMTGESRGDGSGTARFDLRGPAAGDGGGESRLRIVDWTCSPMERHRGRRYSQGLASLSDMESLSTFSQMIWDTNAWRACHSAWRSAITARPDPAHAGFACIVPDKGAY